MCRWPPISPNSRSHVFFFSSILTLYEIASYLNVNLTTFSLK